MSRAISLKKPVNALPPEDIHASFFALGGSMLGLLVTGTGMIWIWVDYTSTAAVYFQSIGPAILALAAATHVGHMARRVGYVSVIVSLLGLLVWSLGSIPFIVNLDNYQSVSWQKFFYICWGIALTLFGITLAIVIGIKSKRVKSGEQNPLLMIHIQTRALYFVGIGWFVFAAGYFLMAVDPSGTRASWILQTAGPLLIAIGVTDHLEDATKHLGYSGVILGIFAAFIWGLSSAPFAFDPNLLHNVKWGLFLSNGIFGLSYILVALTFLLLILRKRSLESQGAHDEEFEGL